MDKKLMSARISAATYQQVVVMAAYRGVLVQDLVGKYLADGIEADGGMAAALDAAAAAHTAAAEKAKAMAAELTA